MGEGNKRLSKRDAGSGLAEYVERGFLPEGLLNYLALLGWGIAEDRDVFTMQEMAEAFDIRRVNPNPARFDLKKLEAINAAHMRLLSIEELERRLVPFLREADLIEDPPTAEETLKITEGSVLIHERVGTLGEGADMLAFLFLDEVVYDAGDVAKVLTEDGLAVVAAAHEALGGLSDWTTAAIDEALRAKLVEELGMKPRHAFGPVRVAVTGRRISPPLFESLELLGREESLARLAAAPAAARSERRRRPGLMSYPQGPQGPQQPPPPPWNTQGASTPAPWPPQPQLPALRTPPSGQQPGWEPRWWRTRIRSRAPTR